MKRRKIIIAAAYSWSSGHSSVEIGLSNGSVACLIKLFTAVTYYNCYFLHLKVYNYEVNAYNLQVNTHSLQVKTFYLLLQYTICKYSIQFTRTACNLQVQQTIYK